MHCGRGNRRGKRVRKRGGGSQQATVPVPTTQIPCGVCAHWTWPELAVQWNPQAVRPWLVRQVGPASDGAPSARSATPSTKRSPIANPSLGTNLNVIGAAETTLHALELFRQLGHPSRRGPRGEIIVISSLRSDHSANVGTLVVIPWRSLALSVVWVLLFAGCTVDDATGSVGAGGSGNAGGSSGMGTAGLGGTGGSAVVGGGPPGFGTPSTN